MELNFVSVKFTCPTFLLVFKFSVVYLFLSDFVSVFFLKFLCDCQLHVLDTFVLNKYFYRYMKLNFCGMETEARPRMLRNVLEQNYLEMFPKQLDH